MKEKEIYQRLDLLRMSLATFRQRINADIDTFEMEITQLIPEEEGRRRRKYTPEESRQRISDIFREKDQHRKKIIRLSCRKQ